MTAGGDREECGRFHIVPRKLSAVDEAINVYGSGSRAAVIGPSCAVSVALIGLLEARGWEVTEKVDKAVDLAVVFVGSQDEPNNTDQVTRTVSVLTDSMIAASDLVGPLEEGEFRSTRRALLTVTAVDGALGYSGSVEPNVAAVAGVSGLVKTFAVESPDVYCRAVDIDPNVSPEQAAECIISEAYDVDEGVHEVGINADCQRMTVSAGPEEDSPLLPELHEVDPPTSGDLIVVTGGGRGVTAACAVGLARTYGCGLLLLGRSALADDPAWAVGVSKDGLRQAAATALSSTGKATPKAVESIVLPVESAREIRETLDKVRSTGAHADYVSVDINDRDALATAISPWRERITGVVHGAGVLKDSLIRTAKGSEVTRVLQTKLAGLSGLIDTLKGVPLRHVVLFSSTAGFFGNQGQAAYAMANEALNRVAVSLRSRHEDIAVTAIDWSAWDGGMVTPALAAMFVERGVPLIPLEVGVACLVEQLSRERSTDVVVGVGPNQPLSGSSTSSGVSPQEISFRRRLSSISAEPLVLDHRIGDQAVLPATAAMGLFLRSLSLGRSSFAEVLRDFEVIKGIVFDDTRPESATVEFVESEAGREHQAVLRDDSGRLRFRAKVGEETWDSAERTEPVVDDFKGVRVNYEDGTLFHGARLRGLDEMIEVSADHVLFKVHSTGASPADGAWGSSDFDPADADLLLQAALVVARGETGDSCLPSSVAEVRTHLKPPRDVEWYIDVKVREVNAPIVVTDVVASTSDGLVLLAMNGVKTVSSPGLAKLFVSQSEN